MRMEEKYLSLLEFPSVLEKLASYAAFDASAALARKLHPTTEIHFARKRQALTSEARLLLSVNSDVTIGGSTDIRSLADLAGRGGALTAAELLAVKTTLIAARGLARAFEKNQQQYPLLSAIAEALPPPAGVIDAISHAISEKGEVLDQASDKLASIRREVKVSHERLMSKLERLTNDPRSAPMLQEAIITQRNGRYVVPLRAEFKGQIRSIVHDQSSSGSTLFVEPLAVVELNNRRHELELEERDEERRILQEISRAVGESHEAIKEIVEALATIDLALMSAKYADDLDAVEPVFYPIQPGGDQPHHPGSVIRLYDARHPLLDPAKVVPIDIDLDDKTFAVIITGPNTGGKTVTLKTVGLLAAMAQSGLHLPVQSGSGLSIFRKIFADIGDEQSIEQSLSTFSAHITNIVHILQAADERSLVLLDELGAGTDPQEGAALARAILGSLLERRITSLIATHYPELKAYAHAAPGVVNASMEFDLQTLRPTYRLTLGLPGKSNALAIAERLGLAPAIIEAARSTLDPNDIRAEDLLNEIHHQRDLARKARAEAEQARQENEKMRQDLARRLAGVEDERRQILENARVETETESYALEREVEEIRKALLRARQPLEALKPIQQKVEEIQNEVRSPVERRPRTGGEETQAPRPGEKVWLKNLNLEGVVTSVGEEEIEVQVGVLRLRARMKDIRRKFEEDEPRGETAAAPGRRNRKTSASQAISAPAAVSVGMELDLRGQRAEDALDALENFLESSYLAGRPFVRIIHGKGTGRLRQVIRDGLKQSEHVARFETGGESEGGDGVTVAHIAQD
jgi:DNA mismatch repair protein MutS2